MRNVRRYKMPGQPVFLAQVCAGRHPALATPDRKMLLLSELHRARTHLDIRVYAWVVLDDHFHLLIDAADERMAKLMYAVKRRVSEQLLRTAHVRGIWQPRYCDHVIRNETDWRAHLDYLHYNPVNHGYVPTAGDYPWSSLAKFSRQGFYPPGWGNAQQAPPTIRGDTGSE